MKCIIKSESELPVAAIELLNSYPDVRIFALYGSMGAGKTTFIKAICQELGVADIVQSPTFSIINEYKTVYGESIFHFDFYRIKKTDEAFDIGYEDYFYSGRYCFLEWPELIESLLPTETIRVRISGETERVIET
ncbi:MAG: tRNA (adenosine(37)-N6)-threonylcarbamoyltransferase complex ATPase subunit type 1 TsaE [Bacteroidetes bacterium]|nr:tRNA (adenosine(37)-N6)-threonylcarbamoyltransferase complex ATPase subunit type 1 TsaE [Bacteroidota bacterium]